MKTQGPSTASPHSGGALGRSVAPLAAGVGAVVAIVGAIAVLGAQVGDATPASSPGTPPPVASAATAGWTDAGVPWVSGGSVHFGTGTLPLSNGQRVASMTATADTALVLVESTDVSELSAISAAGGVERIPADVVGIPIADPVGGVAAWTVRLPDGGLSVRARNFATGAEDEVAGDFRPLGVEGSTVLLVDGDGNSFLWRLGRSERSAPDAVEGVLVTDSHAGARLVTDFTDQATRVESGDTVVSIPSFGFGTFSPDGAYVALAGQAVPELYDARSGQRVDLSLPAGLDAESLRWSPSGSVVVRAIPHDADPIVSPDAPASFHLCEPGGACAVLPDTATTVQLAGGTESSAFGQFRGMVG